MWGTRFCASCHQEISIEGGTNCTPVGIEHRIASSHLFYVLARVRAVGQHLNNIGDRKPPLSVMQSSPYFLAPENHQFGFHVSLLIGNSRGRNAGSPTPTTQIPACATNAIGSYLGYDAQALRTDTLFVHSRRSASIF